MIWWNVLTSQDILIHLAVNNFSPNTYHVCWSDRRLLIKAARPIEEGEPITICKVPISYLNFGGIVGDTTITICKVNVILNFGMIENDEKYYTRIN